jgi:hypothetical protein
VNKTLYFLLTRESGFYTFSFRSSWVNFLILQVLSPCMKYWGQSPALEGRCILSAGGLTWSHQLTSICLSYCACCVLFLSPDTVSHFVFQCFLCSVRYHQILCFMARGLTEQVNSGDKASGFYSESPKFESLPGYRLSSLRFFRV